jgi:subtilisin family serine protease
VNVPALWTNLGLPVHGENIKVGVIDTGIDYTHANFGGPGTVAAFTGVDANAPTTLFPNAKVVGGWDFAGTNYDAGSNDPAQYTPVPDGNPIDEAGHGSHVSGTIAGFGVNADGSTYGGSYDVSLDTGAMRIGPGAAPKAVLYALKVFGKEGSTNLAERAMEWATDPNGDGDFSDHLDVVNLSLGSQFGTSSEMDVSVYGNAANAMGLSRSGDRVILWRREKGEQRTLADAAGRADGSMDLRITAAAGSRFQFAMSTSATRRPNSI